MNKSNDQIYSYIFHKNKKDYYEFNPKPDVEEIPTFSFENDRNINTYKGNIFNKQAIIEQNSNNYINYMKQFEKRKAPLRTPYAVYQEITKKNLINNNYNKISLNKNITNNNTNINTNNNDNINSKNINDINNTNINGSKKSEWNEKYSNNYLHNNSINNIKPLYNSISVKSLLFDNRKNEITNPDSFYKRNNNDYYKYRAEQKKYLDYNYQILKNKNKLHDKKEPDINPYNPKKEDFEHYKSDLPHNPILNPINYYSYNKYLEKEIKENNNNYQNIINNKRNYTPFQKAANQIFK